MVTLLLGLAWILLSAAHIEAQTRTPALKKLIKAAAAEGELNMLGSGIDAAQAWPKWEKALNAMYGINVNLKFTRGPSMPRMASRLVKEYKAGRAPTTDIYIGSESHISRILKSNALETPNWKEIAPRIPTEALAPGNVAVVIASRMPGVTYNTKLVSKDEVPRTLEDLLNPKWKGKIASTPYAASFDRAAMVVGDERVTKFLRDLARENLAGLIRCGEDERIISGEFNMLALTCGGGAIELLKAKGAPIDHTILEDIPLVSYFYLGVPKRSAHPNMAKLFTVFMTTKEAQKILWQGEGYDMHMVEGTNTYRLVQGLRKKGVEPRVFGVKEVVANQKAISAMRRKYQKILKGQ